MPGVKDVAARAGVSAATVSRVLNGHPNVKADKRAAVLGAAQALGYASNALAAGLRRKDTRTVGVMLARQSSPFSARLHHAIEGVLSREGYLALVCSTHADPERERAYVRMLLDMDLGGLIIRPSSSMAMAARHAAQFERAGVPVVFCENAPEGPRYSQVVTDNFHGGREAIRHLHALGHRDIALLVKGWDRRQRSLSPGYRRVQGALAEARALGIADRLRLCPDNPGERFDFGHRAMQDLLAKGPRPTAVFATTDMMGLGAISALREAGLDVPGDVSVLGFDGLPIAGMAVPALATLDQQIVRLGETAAELLIDRLRHKAPPRQITLTPELRLRDSLGIPPHRRSASHSFPSRPQD